MIENISGILSVASSVFFIYLIFMWVKIGQRTKKALDDYEEINSADSPKCDYSPGDDWLDEHMD